MRSNEKNSIQIKTRRNACVILFFLCCSLLSFGQTDPIVEARLDTAKITIGEEIKYTLKVETDQTTAVVFPEGQTFSPLEMIESYKVDTSFAQAKKTLIKRYGLTQFDSGFYKIPKQRVIIGGKTFETDSFNVAVKNVVLDTVNQGLYDIKPAIEVPKNYGRLLWEYLKWILPVVIAIGLFLYFLLRRHKKKKEEEKYVAPFDQALATLKALDETKLIENQEYKAYYTTLTDAVRRYYDEKVYDRALESTTDELIQRLTAERESGHIKFNTETIKQLKDIFQRADLVKFARINPPEGKALADRIAVEQIVKQTKEVLPAPSEDELMKDALYREALSRKRKRKLWLTGIIGVLGILIVATGIGIAVKGYSEVKDFVLGNQTRELAEGKWITSEYGYPGLVISSPKPLVRTEINVQSEGGQQPQVTSFSWKTTPVAINATVTQLQLPSKDAIDLEALIDNNLKGIEALGFKLGLVKNDPYKTPNGAEGIKTFGSGTFTQPNVKGSISIDYASLTFQAETNIQILTLIWKSDDEYAKQIADRMLASLELQKGEN